MRRIFAFICLFCLLLSGCGASEPEREITCEEVVAAYEAAGYDVFHKHPAGEGNIVCYVTAEDASTGEQIFFHFFPTAEEAEGYADEREYHVLIWLFSVIYGDPTWVHTTTYGNIEIEYDNKALYEPFEDLI